MAGTPLETKLGIKAGQVVFLDHPPAGFELNAPTTARLPRQAAITLTFQTERRRLQQRIGTLVQHTEPAGMIWVCWPKQTAVKAGLATSDLDDGQVREIGLAAGVVDVKVCAIDEVWSALKFVRRLADRT